MPTPEDYQRYAEKTESYFTSANEPETVSVSNTDLLVETIIDEVEEVCEMDVLDCFGEGNWGRKRKAMLMKGIGGY